MTPINLRFDFYRWTARISTWLAAISASCAAGLGAYAIMPMRAQDAFPEWALVALGVTSVVAALGVPIATSFKQKPKQ